MKRQPWPLWEKVTKHLLPYLKFSLVIEFEEMHNIHYLKYLFTI